MNNLAMALSIRGSIRRRRRYTKLHDPVLVASIVCGKTYAEFRRKLRVLLGSIPKSFLAPPSMDQKTLKALSSVGICVTDPVLTPGLESPRSASVKDDTSETSSCSSISTPLP
ncbi:hypothetical protein CLAIMM_14789 [Cladophialophora immunda]|nr:hypothetical protein CLAIMM_14789 [Cladophialophora immunda]